MQRWDEFLSPCHDPHRAPSTWFSASDGVRPLRLRMISTRQDVPNPHQVMVSANKLEVKFVSRSDLGRQSKMSQEIKEGFEHTLGMGASERYCLRLPSCSIHYDQQARLAGLSNGQRVHHVNHHSRERSVNIRDGM